MQRTILTPAALPAAALGELKDWLAITASGEDAPLTRLLLAALGLCEGFTGHLPLEAECEELLPASAAWQVLATHPVQAIVAVSYSEIFHGNCVAMGLPAVRVSQADSEAIQAAIEADPKAEVVVDVEANQVRVAMGLPFRHKIL